MTTASRAKGIRRRAINNGEARKALALLADSWDARLDRIEANVTKIKAILDEREGRS